MKIVVHGDEIADQLDVVRAAAPAASVAHVGESDDLVAEVADAEILFARFVADEVAAAAGRLAWLQTASAGVDWLARTRIAQLGWTVTNAAGVHAVPVAETAVTLMFGVARGLQRAVRSQVAHVWTRQSDVFEIQGKTAGVVGLGGIGRHLAGLLHGLDLRVLAVDIRPNTRPATVRELRHSDDLGWLLGESDVVFVTAPLTPVTHHLFNAASFDRMKSGAILINVSRGGLVHTDDLIVALDAGPLFGAGLDVVEDEPLPPDHPLWERTDVIVGGHSGGRSPLRSQRLASLFADNLRRYQDKQPLHNVVDLSAGF